MVETTQTVNWKKKTEDRERRTNKIRKALSLPCLAMDPTQMDDFRFDQLVVVDLANGTFCATKAMVGHVESAAGPQ